MIEVQGASQRQFESQGLEVNFPANPSTFHRHCLSLQQRLFSVSPTCAYYLSASDTTAFEGQDFCTGICSVKVSSELSFVDMGTFVVSGSFGVLDWTSPPSSPITMAHPQQTSKLDPFFSAPAGMRLEEDTKEVHEAIGTHQGWEPQARGDGILNHKNH